MQVIEGVQKGQSPNQLMLKGDTVMECGEPCSLFEFTDMRGIDCEMDCCHS